MIAPTTIVTTIAPITAALMAGRPRRPSVARSNTDPTATWVPAVSASDRKASPRRGTPSPKPRRIDCGAVSSRTRTAEGPVIAVANAATLACSRCRTSRPIRHDRNPNPAAAASDSVVNVNSTTSIFPAPLPQREFDRHFDQHVDGDAFALRGGEAPLTDRADSALVQAIAKALQHMGVADTAVAPHD